MGLEDWYIETSKAYAQRVRTELDARWEAWPITPDSFEVHEVVGAFLARQGGLAIKMATIPDLWNSELAPLILRTMADAHITVAYILKDPVERSRSFIDHGLGQEKLTLEHAKSVVGEDDPQVAAKTRWIDSQRFTYLTEVNIGSWTGGDMRKMADEVGLLDFYRLRFQPLSNSVHNMWNHIGIYNLTRCDNPLHRYHSVPVLVDHSPEPHFWDAAAEQLHDTFQCFDEKLGISVDVEPALQLLQTALATCAEEREKEMAVEDEPQKKAPATPERSG